MFVHPSIGGRDKKTPEDFLRQRENIKEAVCASDGLFVFRDPFYHQPYDRDADDGVQIIFGHKVLTASLKQSQNSGNHADDHGHDP